MWGGGPSTGGLIGELATDYESDGSETPDPIIKGNFINLSSLKAFEPDGEPNFDGEYDTFHRIIGKSCANEEPEPIFDANWNIIGYGDMMVETILADNYAADNLAVCNTEIADEATTTEGKSISSDELGKEFFEKLGYTFGSEISAPWSEASPKSPRLFFEGGIIVFESDEYELGVDENADLLIGIFGETANDDILGELTIDIADESVIEYVSLSVADGKIAFTVKGLKEGTTTVTASYNGQTATAGVTVIDKSGIEDVNAEASSSIEYRDGVVTAEGCLIEVYSTTGTKVLAGTGSCDLGNLAGGVYIVSATDKSGRHALLKVIR